MFCRPCTGSLRYLKLIKKYKKLRLEVNMQKTRVYNIKRTSEPYIRRQRYNRTSSKEYKYLGVNFEKMKHLTPQLKID